MSKYVIVDLEMCKVPKPKRTRYKGSCEIIEIGAVLLDDNFEITDRFKTYVSPAHGIIDRFIQNLTGITTEDIKNAPSLKEALEIFVQWLPEDAIPVSWSINDERQIRKEIEHKNIDICQLGIYLDRWEDCQITFSEKMNSSKIYKLSEALIIADIDYDENLHDGLVDAENTAMLFAKMMREDELDLIYCYTTEDEDNTMYTPISLLLKNCNFAL